MNTLQLCTNIATELLRRQWLLATAESCTGGLIAATCTEMAGSSQWFDRGLVSYSNAAKTDILGVPEALIQNHGAVSDAVALAMALGALARSDARVSLAVTGIAGPSGGSAQKPVGTVHFAWGLRTAPWDTLPFAKSDCAANPALLEPHCAIRSEMLQLDGDRASVRQATVFHALGTLQDWLGHMQ